MVSAPNHGAIVQAVTWAGHATVLVETEGRRLLTDPVLGRRVGLLHRLARPVPPGVADDIDAVLISHAHTDHLDLPSLRRLGKDVPVIAPPAAAAVLRRRGFAFTREVTAGSVVTLRGVTVQVTAARHDGRRWPYGPAAEAVGFLVHGDTTVYFAGDTDLFPEMSLLAGRVDVAFLPVAGWGPTLGPGHLDPDRAAVAAATIQPRVAIPIHWGTLAPPVRRPAREALTRPPRAFAEAVSRLAPDVEVRVLAPGERTAFAREMAESPRR